MEGNVSVGKGADLSFCETVVTGYRIIERNTITIKIYGIFDRKILNPILKTIRWNERGDLCVCETVGMEANVSVERNTIYIYIHILLQHFSISLRHKLLPCSKDPSPILYLMHASLMHDCLCLSNAWVCLCMNISVPVHESLRACESELSECESVWFPTSKEGQSGNRTFTVLSIMALLSAINFRYILSLIHLCSVFHFPLFVLCNSFPLF